MVVVKRAFTTTMIPIMTIINATGFDLATRGTTDPITRDYLLNS